MAAPMHLSKSMRTATAVLGALALGLASLSAPALAAKKKKAEAAAAEVLALPAQPLNLIVSLKKQKLFIYHGTELVAASPVSTGQRGFPTPTGVFSILEKNRTHYSNLYGGAPMPFMQRVTWTGTALHAGVLPGYPASHGCIRLPHGFAKKLFGITRMNNHIIITTSETPPAEISHPLLFQPMPKPPAATAATQGGVVTASLDTTATDTAAPKPPSTEPLRMLIARRSEQDIVRSVQTMMKELGYEVGDLDGYLGKVSRNIMQIYQRIHGLKQTDTVSVEVLDHLSQATGRGPARDWHIFVKQGFDDLFDAPVTLRDPDLPIGTHLFQALDFGETATETRWTTMPGDEASAAFAPSEVLDRIDIPAETRERIASLLTPGSSLLVTDRGKSDETNEYTGFIVRLPASKGAATVESDGEAGVVTIQKRKKRASATTIRLRSATSRYRRARARDAGVYFWD